MLAKTAERMYWLGRYVERAENTARLISVNTNLVLDLPKVKHIWSGMIDITGNRDEFLLRFSREDERNVVKYLLAHEVGSLRNAVRMARENARTTREIMPTEAWEAINEMHIYVRENLEMGYTRERRHEFLAKVINRCHQLNGLLAANMSVDQAYNFAKLGRNLERADMTTRIVDVGCLTLMDPADGDTVEYANILWMNVLKSLTAYQMYRQHVQDVVNGEDVVDFLLRNGKFPRAVAHCLNEALECCLTLPRNDDAARSINHTLRTVSTVKIDELLQQEQLHQFIDEIQLDLASIHEKVSGTWFGHEPGPAPTSAPVEEAESATGAVSATSMA